MEINDQSQPYCKRGETRISTSAHQASNNSADYFVSSAQLLERVSNFIVVLSMEGRLKRVSHSFAHFIGYSEGELQHLDFKNLFADGELPLKEIQNGYYYERSLISKNNSKLKVIWRYLPNVLINSIVFVGYPQIK